jgi:hypothetical protein
MKAMRKHGTIKSQDVLVLLKLLISTNEIWLQKDLAQALYLSTAEVSNALGRLEASKLFSSERQAPNVGNAIEFLVHGVKYIFPARFGGISLGLGTAHSAPPLCKKLKNSSSYVWPCQEGVDRGEILYPIYGTVCQVALRDKNLYECLALLDAIRIGRPRETKIAIEELQKRVSR